MLLSYIVPLYDAGRSIGDCLDSIFADKSDDSDYEVIVVDDGSRDDGAAIVAGYAETHPNVRLIRQKNGGASAARNTAIDAARSEWIRFVDADDRVVPFSEPLTVLLRRYESADMLTFNYITLTNDGGTPIDSYTTVGIITGLDILRNQHLYLWDKVFSRRLIGNCHFVEGTANQEDMFFCIQTLPAATKVVTIPERGYVYDCRSATSTTRTITPRQYVRNYQDSVVIQGFIRRIIDDMPEGETRSVIEDILHESVINHFYIIFRFYSYRRVLRAMRDYGRIGLYPLGKCHDRRKNFFAAIANHPRLLRLMARLRWMKLSVSNDNR